LAISHALRTCPTFRLVSFRTDFIDATVTLMSFIAGISRLVSVSVDLSVASPVALPRDETGPARNAQKQATVIERHFCRNFI
jgi:hypothetical protein